MCPWQLCIKSRLLGLMQNRLEKKYWELYLDEGLVALKVMLKRKAQPGKTIRGLQVTALPTEIIFLILWILFSGIWTDPKK